MLPSGDYVSTVGGSVDLNCLSHGDMITHVQWLLNGSPVEEGPNVEIVMFGTAGLILRLRNLSVEYNTSTIQCRATLESGITRTSEGTLLLLLQGTDIMCS